ncbi:hypothetical protein OESDEN_06265 [Oesophagostomum dentatum]|uniref:Uncharacterized protein n=1 Tax=Oesophagostomum dentatum TaxID=61180 RepID=A0A0B1TCH6_OESDE|nr:hypothetical protein OESDEN_06265 [Oesophagostomum dentatum]
MESQCRNGVEEYWISADPRKVDRVPVTGIITILAHKTANLSYSMIVWHQEATSSKPTMLVKVNALIGNLLE